MSPDMRAIGKGPPLIAHVIDRLVIGGMENGIANLINETPPERYRHVILCLHYADDFRDRIARGDEPRDRRHPRPGRDARSAEAELGIGQLVMRWPFPIGTRCHRSRCSGG